MCEDFEYDTAKKSVFVDSSDGELFIHSEKKNER